jgi:hypothetical protein
VSRFWLITAGLAALGAFQLIRHRLAQRVGEPKFDEVSSDWLNYARSRSDESL